MKNLFKNLKFSWQYVKNDKKYLFIITIVNIIDIILNVITPILSAKIIIELTTNNYKRMVLIAIMIFIVNFLSSMVHFIARTFSTKMYRNALSKIEVDLGSNMLKLDNNCLDSNSSGVFIQRLTNDTTRMADVFNSMLGIISTILKDVGVFIAIFVVNKIMFFYTIITMIILYYLEKVRTDIRNRDDKEFRIYKEKVSGFIGELVRGARDIRMLNSENDFIGELDKRITTTNDKMRLMHINSIKYSTITKSFNKDKLVNFIVVDTETTGLKASSGRIVQLSAVKYVDWEATEVWNSLIDPKMDISKSASDINGITNELVSGKPTIKQVAKSFIEFVSGYDVIGYNLPFDLKFLYAEGIDLTQTKRKYYDVLALVYITNQKSKKM